MHPRAAAQCKFDAHRHRVSGGGWPAPQKAAPTKHIWFQPLLSMRPFIDIAVGHADHPPSPAISSADDP
jgi:hypothetical protein